MSLTDLLRRFERAASLLSIGGRTLLGLDTNPVSAEWNHITKVDPESGKKLPLLYPAYLAHSSAISVGGSRDVTDKNTEETFDLVTQTATPAFHEPSEATHVTGETRDQADFLAVPEVLNGDTEALIGTLGRGLEYVRTDLGPAMVEDKVGLPLNGFFGDRVSDFAAGYLMQDAVFEAYIIMNLDSAAAREANVTEDDLLSPQQAKERALAAEHHLESEIIYLEYSGTFGGDEAADLLEAIDDGVSWSRIWYGGGLDSRENVNKVLDAGADAVVVGDVFHRVAEVEADLIAQAREEFDASADHEALREWVEETVDVAETEAGRYLSTIQHVTSPDEQASEYLATAVELALVLDEIAAGLDDPAMADIEDALAGETLPGEEAVGSEGTAGLRQVARAALAQRFDVAGEDRELARHLALD
jgi:phosphoglycerol geranylgeranyltransferase